jgi:hypothetical protein
MPHLTSTSARMTQFSYQIHPHKRWLAAIDVENFPGVDPNTEDGKSDLIAYASLIFFQDQAIQHVVIRQNGKVIGEAANGGSALEEIKLH